MVDSLQVIHLTFLEPLLVMSEVDVSEVAEITGESEDTIFRKGLESYVSRELKEAKARVKEIKEGYDTDNPKELEEMIESGEVDEHPAWEELIEWRNLKERIENLKQY